MQTINEISDSDYKEMLRQRGREKQKNYISFKTFDGTVITESSMFELGKDYNLGDFVSVVDETLGVILDVQITSISHSLTRGKDVIDLGFGYEKATVRQILRKDGLL